MVALPEPVPKTRPRYSGLAKGIGPMRSRAVWNEEEENYVQDNWSKMLLTDIAAYLRRTRNAVQAKGNGMGLRDPLREVGVRTGKPEPRPDALCVRITHSRDKSRTRLVPKNRKYAVYGMADRAADFLRSHDRTVLYRCDESGKADQQGENWKYGFGSLVITEEEMVAKAERKGWDDNAWRRLS